MKNKNTLVLSVLFLALVMVLAPTANAFTFTAGNFSGLAAYDKGGDVISTFGDHGGVDSRFGYDYTGQHYNFTASMVFDFAYNPTYPSIEDIIANPNTQWHWTATIRNLEMPCSDLPLPEMKWETVASFREVKYGTELIGNTLAPYAPRDLIYSFDYEINDPLAGTGSAYMSMAGNFDALYGFNDIPYAGIGDFSSGVEIELSAQPVPEPITLALFGIGLAGMGVVRKRMNK